MMPETKRIVSDWLGADANKFCDQTGFLYLTDDWEPKISFNSAWGKGLHYYYISFERVFLPNRCFHKKYGIPMEDLVRAEQEVLAKHGLD